MSKAKHTPGRLHVDESGNIWNHVGRLVANCGGYSSGFAYKENGANAERVVRCWNSYDDLLAGCEEARVLVDISSLTYARLCRAIEKAKEKP